MNQITWTAVDDYFCELLAPSDQVLDDALRRSDAAGLPRLNVTANQGKFLYLLAKIRGARRILEIGTFAGYSTIWLARALPNDGQLISIEFNRMNVDIAKANIAQAGLSDVVDLRMGKALDVLPRLVQDKTPPFDLIFIDADRPHTPEYLDWALKLSRSGTVIIADNVVRHGDIIDPDNTKPGVEGIRHFFQRMADEPRLSATALQTVGSKGYDGFSIAVVD